MGGEQYRNANPNATKPHSLITKTKGKNRYSPGVYTCKCGETFAGIASFERHRASARKEEKKADASNPK
jgi:hypothetical protein